MRFWSDFWEANSMKKRTYFEVLILTACGVVSKRKFAIFWRSRPSKNIVKTMVFERFSFFLLLGLGMSFRWFLTFKISPNQVLFHDKSYLKNRALNKSILCHIFTSFWVNLGGQKPRTNQEVWFQNALFSKVILNLVDFGGCCSFLVKSWRF